MASPGSHLRAAAGLAAWVLAKPGRAPLPAQSARFPSSTHERGAPTFEGHRVRRLSMPRRRKPTASFRRSLPSRTVARLGLGLVECTIRPGEFLRSEGTVLRFPLRRGLKAPVDPLAADDQV